MKIEKLKDKSFFKKIYNKYVFEENVWKKRSLEQQEQLFKNFYVYKENNQILWWFSINKFKDWYLIETLFSEQKWVWKKIINFVVKKYKKVYAFSKKQNFYWFKKLNEKSESGASLFVNE